MADTRIVLESKESVAAAELTNWSGDARYPGPQEPGRQPVDLEQLNDEMVNAGKLPGLNIDLRDQSKQADSPLPSVKERLAAGKYPPATESVAEQVAEKTFRLEQINPNEIRIGEKIEITPELVQDMIDDLKDGNISEKSQKVFALLFNDVKDRKSAHEHNTDGVKDLAAKLTEGLRKAGYPDAELSFVPGKTVMEKDGSSRTDYSMKLQLTKNGEPQSVKIGGDWTPPYPKLTREQLLQGVKEAQGETRKSLPEAQVELTQEQKQERILAEIEKAKTMTPEQAKEALAENAEILAKALGQIKPENFANVPLRSNSDTREAASEEAFRDALEKSFNQFVEEHGGAMFVEAGVLAKGHEEMPMLDK